MFFWGKNLRKSLLNNKILSPSVILRPGYGIHCCQGAHVLDYAASSIYTENPATCTQNQCRKHIVSIHIASKLHGSLFFIPFFFLFSIFKSNPIREFKVELFLPTDNTNKPAKYVHSVDDGQKVKDGSK